MVARYPMLHVASPSCRASRSCPRGLLQLLLASLLASASALRCGGAIAAGTPASALARPSQQWAYAATVRPRALPAVMELETPKAPAPSAVPKQQLIDMIAARAGVSKKTAGLVLKASLDVIVDSVCDGSKTGEPMTIKAARVPSFTFGKSFKDAVKESGIKES